MAGGKSHLIGAIYMACLNLPMDICYQSENIYLVGIISSPKELSLKQINHFLKPLVDDLIVLWLTGIYLAQMAAWSTGWLVQEAVIILIYNLPTMCKVAGFTAHSHKKYFYLFCRLPRTNINTTTMST